MLIKLSRSGTRNRLTCVRADGTFTQSDLGPRVPFHDLAHFVAEKNLNIREGFFGNIQRGFSVEELSSKEVILSLGPESRISEVLARTLQLLGSGACAKEEFAQLINAELQIYGIPHTLELNTEIIDAMEAEYRALIGEWNAVNDGGTLDVEWPENA
jgi:hypothetical protein